MALFTNTGCSIDSQCSWLTLVGIEPACRTSEPSSNASWNALAHPVYETFYVICVIQCMHLRTITLNVQ